VAAAEGWVEALRHHGAVARRFGSGTHKGIGAVPVVCGRCPMRSGG
jgi:hypothetical protein